MELPLNKFGIAIMGGLLQYPKLIQDLDVMLARVGENAAQVRAAVDDPQWRDILEQAGALHKEQKWTLGDLDRLAKAGDARASVLSAPLQRTILQHSAMLREANAITFPRLTWSSVVVAVLSEWEVVLRGYVQYLSHHLAVSGPRTLHSIGERLMQEFKEFANNTVALNFDFGSSTSWCNMNGHRRVRNLIVHWGGRIAGPGVDKAERFIVQRPEQIERHDDRFVCRRKYAESVHSDASRFITAFDEVLLDRFPQLWNHGA